MGTANENPSALFSAKLAESGLNEKERKRLGMELLSPKSVIKLNPNFKEYPALRIPYFTLDGKKTSFYRLRYLGHMNGFDAIRKKQVRYVQPEATTVEAYFPTLVDWVKLSKDNTRAVFITEGELKAACASKCGFPTIGLGGVWSWRSAKKSIPILPILTKIDWKERPVYIVFDSDFATNPDVMRAMIALAKELTSFGAQPYMVTLPELPELMEKEKKTGLDDFLVAKGVEEFDQLIVEAIPFDTSHELWKLNGEVVYIRHPGLVIVHANGRKISPAAFKDHVYANRHYYETQFDAEGEKKLVKKPLAPAWLKWECRAELDSLTYKPGAPPITDANEFNYWPGWAVEPKKGDITLWKQLLDYIFQGNQNARTWFERWCAYPIQHPGTKLYSASVLWGRAHGTGKSLIGYSLGKIYGSNFGEISDEDLSGSFNEWAENKQFIMGDDVTSAEHKKAQMEILKFMITRQKLRVNAKFLPTYEVPDVINYYFTANAPDAFLLDDLDRRYFIWEMPDKPMPREFYERFDKWLHQGDLGAAMLYHFQHLDLGTFNPREHAMITSAKKRMIADSKNEVAAWCAHLAEFPDEVLKLGKEVIKADLFTTTQLMQLFDRDGNKKVSSVWLGKELKKAGFDQVNEGAVVLTDKGPQRLYAVRNKNKWIKAKVKDIAAHWNEFFASSEKEKKPVKKKGGERF